MKTLDAVLAFAAVSIAVGQTKYYAFYIQGTKIGYAIDTESRVKYNGHPAIKSISRSVMSGMVRGVDSKSVSDSVTVTDLNDNMLRYKESTASGGRIQRLDEEFGTKTVEIAVDTSGVKTHKSIRLPSGPIVDDPMHVAKHQPPPLGKSVTYWNLDDSSLSFKPVKLTFIGRSTTVLSGTKITANRFDVEDDGLTLRVFATSDGEMVHVEGPMGMEVRPVSKAVALAEPGKGAKSVDIAELASIKTDKPIDSPDTCTDLKLRVLGFRAKSLPSDPGQTSTKDSDGWIVDIHPTKFDATTPSLISAARAGCEKWAQPSLYIPSASPKFIQLAAKIVGDRKDVLGASTAIMNYISGHMKYVDGIDVPRDAAEILKTGEGVCRDYAVLTATLLRAAGIPARMVVGLVYDRGAFFGHAWNEAWDGRQWVGIDSTNNVLNLPAEYIKLSDGSVEDTLGTTPPLEATITVLSVQH